MASVRSAAVAQQGGSTAVTPAPSVPQTGNGVTATAESGESIREFYAENGYYILPDALTPVEVEELRAETTAICKGERGDVDGFEPGMAGENEDDVLRNAPAIGAGPTNTVKDGFRPGDAPEDDD